MVSADSNSTNRTKVENLLKAAVDSDKDVRFMALLDLNSHLTQNPLPDGDKLWTAAAAACVERLNDASIEVQSNASKSIGNLFLNSNSFASVTLTELLNRFESAAEEQKRDVYSNCLRYLLTLPFPSKKAASLCCSRIIEKMLQLLQGEFSRITTKAATKATPAVAAASSFSESARVKICYDLLSLTIEKCKSEQLSEFPHNEKVMETLSFILYDLNTAEIGVKKKTANLIGLLAQNLPSNKRISLAGTLVNRLIQIKQRWIPTSPLSPQPAAAPAAAAVSPEFLSICFYALSVLCTSAELSSAVAPAVPVVTSTIREVFTTSAAAAATASSSITDGQQQQLLTAQSGLAEEALRLLCCLVRTTPGAVQSDLINITSIGTELISFGLTDDDGDNSLTSTAAAAAAETNGGVSDEFEFEFECEEDFSSGCQSGEEFDAEAAAAGCRIIREAAIELLQSVAATEIATLPAGSPDKSDCSFCCHSVEALWPTIASRLQFESDSSVKNHLYRTLTKFVSMIFGENTVAAPAASAIGTSNAIKQMENFKQKQNLGGYDDYGESGSNDDSFDDFGSLQSLQSQNQTSYNKIGLKLIDESLATIVSSVSKGFSLSASSNSNSNSNLNRQSFESGLVLLKTIASASPTAASSVALHFLDQLYDEVVQMVATQNTLHHHRQTQMLLIQIIDVLSTQASLIVASIHLKRESFGIVSNFLDVFQQSTSLSPSSPTSSASTPIQVFHSLKLTLDSLTILYKHINKKNVVENQQQNIDSVCSSTSVAFSNQLQLQLPSNTAEIANSLLQCFTQIFTSESQSKKHIRAFECFAAVLKWVVTISSLNSTAAPAAAATSVSLQSSFRLAVESYLRHFLNHSSSSGAGEQQQQPDRLVLEVYRDLQLFAIKNSPPLLLSLLLFDKRSSALINGGFPCSAAAAAAVDASSSCSAAAAVIPYLQANVAASIRNGRNFIYLEILMDLAFSSKVMKEIFNMLRNNNNNNDDSRSSSSDWMSLSGSLSLEKILLISEDFMNQIMKDPIDDKLAESLLVLATRCFHIEPQLYAAAIKRSYLQILPVLLNAYLVSCCDSKRYQCIKQFYAALILHERLVFSSDGFLIADLKDKINRIETTKNGGKAFEKLVSDCHSVWSLLNDCRSLAILQSANEDKIKANYLNEVFNAVLHQTPQTLQSISLCGSIGFYTEIPVEVYEALLKLLLSSVVDPSSFISTGASAAVGRICSSHQSFFCSLLSEDNLKKMNAEGLLAVLKAVYQIVQINPQRPIKDMQMIFHFLEYLSFQESSEIEQLKSRVLLLIITTGITNECMMSLLLSVVFQHQKAAAAAEKRTRNSAFASACVKAFEDASSIRKFPIQILEDPAIFCSLIALFKIEDIQLHRNLYGFLSNILSSSNYSNYNQIQQILMLPSTDKDLRIQSNLIREIDLGPFKKKVDDGLPMRTKANDFLYSCCIMLRQDSLLNNSNENLVQTTEAKVLRYQRKKQRKTIADKIYELVQIGYRNDSDSDVQSICSRCNNELTLLST